MQEKRATRQTPAGLRGAERVRRSEAVRPILLRALQKHRVHLPRRISPSLWARAVGPFLAARAQPTVLSAGTLHVLVEDHRWRDQLDAARRFLMEKLNLHLGGEHVRALQFGLAHEGALDEARRLLEPLSEARIEPDQVLGRSQLEPLLREAVLKAAEAASRRAARA
jgi:predicted nucleic acid-binding Zn ribbon protein